VYFYSKMVRALICLIVLVSITITTAFPQQQQRGRVSEGLAKPRTVEEEERLRPKVYETSHQIALQNKGDGKYKYYAEYSDGLTQEQEGSVNRPNPSAVKEGSYTTFDENGQVVTIDYIADKHGFQPANLPQPPQESEEHQKAREEILRLQKEIRAEHLAQLRAGYNAYGQE